MKSVVSDSSVDALRVPFNCDERCEHFFNFRISENSANAVRMKVVEGRLVELFRFDPTST